MKGSFLGKEVMEGRPRGKTAYVPPSSGPLTMACGKTYTKTGEGRRECHSPMTTHCGRGSEAALSFLATSAKQEMLPSLALTVTGEQEADQFFRRHKDLEMNATRDTSAWDLQWGRTAHWETCKFKEGQALRAYPEDPVCAGAPLMGGCRTHKHMGHKDRRDVGLSFPLLGITAPFHGEPLPI